MRNKYLLLTKLAVKCASGTRSGGWKPRRDGRLEHIIKEALDENAPDGSLWRFLYTQNNDLKPVIIFGVIHIDWKDNFKSPKKKPKEVPTV